MAPIDKNTPAQELVHNYATHIKDRVILTTGVSPGSLGSYFVQCIAAAEPRCLVLAGRTRSKIQQTADEIKASHPSVETRLLEVDLASLDSVRQAAEQINSWEDIPAIDVVVNNAAIMATEYALSAEGVEAQFATNHLGPFLLTNLIMGKVLAAGRPRVVMVASDGHRLSGVRFGDYNFDDGKTYNRWLAYGQAKTANMLMAMSLAEKLGSRNLLAFSLHPGVIITNLANHLLEEFESSFGELSALDRAQGNPEGWKGIDPKPLETGVATHIYAAFDPDLAEHNGKYLTDCHVADPWVDTVKPWATSQIEAERLWKLSEELVGEKFSY
ncbi:hypothetical protein CNMCM5793_000142 [Aspergillus hiratsukae]|uniref:Short-chain dehydrogenase n=1 Tax=Aspergillus hiratsukae TaxID=1194566 RepID=A0A8H6Q4U3_9EURO|nr:hypothetical protein CNMCM5793_000142 [Aspergillus hiratsukae]KAF7165591.1 hypothetical protein CNMCM6106_001672 [Aspergillus hiratsukae]